MARRVYAADLPSEAHARLLSQLFEFTPGVSTTSRKGARIAVAVSDQSFPDVERLTEAGFVEYPPESDVCDVAYGKR
jgi:hypothetical protein